MSLKNRKTLRTRYRELDIREQMLDKNEEAYHKHFTKLQEDRNDLNQKLDWFIKMRQRLLPTFPNGANWNVRELYWIYLPAIGGYVLIHNFGKVIFPNFGHTLTYITGWVMLVLMMIGVLEKYKQHNIYVILKGDYVDDEEKKKKHKARRKRKW